MSIISISLWARLLSLFGTFSKIAMYILLATCNNFHSYPFFPADGDKGSV